MWYYTIKAVYNKAVCINTHRSASLLFIDMAEAVVFFHDGSLLLDIILPGFIVFMYTFDLMLTFSKILLR